MVLVAPATDNTHDVIDGQQRLTTLFLLMVAMQQRALEMQDAATSDAIRGMITRVAFDTGAAVSTPSSLLSTNMGRHFSGHPSELVQH